MNLLFRLVLHSLLQRGKPCLEIWDTAVTSFRAQLTDLDILGHVNNGKFLSILDIARLDLLKRSGMWAQLKRRGWYPVVAGQTITYRRSLTLGQRFEVHTRFLGSYDRWTYVEQTFAVDGHMAAQAVVRTRFLKREGGTVSPNEIESLTGPIPYDRTLPEWVSAWTDGSRTQARPS